MDTKTIAETHKLNNFVHENASQYHHSRQMTSSNSSLVLPNKTRHKFNIHYDIKDLFTIAALTDSSVLMTGGTDLGKTTLAKLIMNSLLGREDQGWHRIDVDLDFGKDAYTDVDFSAVTEGRKLSDGLYLPSKYLMLPGLILDEINRSHAALVNKLLHIFDKDISLPDGSRKKLGAAVKNDKTYQFQIAAINEGEEYRGTFEVDKALRRRTVIEIPMDRFPLTPYDQLCIKKQTSKEVVLKNEKNNLEAIISILNKVEQIPLHPTAEMFLAYLEAFDYCKNSLTGEKGSIEARNGSIHHICTQPIRIGNREIEGGDVSCPFVKSFANNLCPYVRAITPGISKNLTTVAKGFALIRATKFVEMLAGYLEGIYEKSMSYEILNHELFTESLQKYTGVTGVELKGKELVKKAIEKYFNSLEVEREDIQAAVGFVGYSKIGISKPWIVKYFQGNRYESVVNFSREAIAKFEEGLAKTELMGLDELLQELKDGKVSDERIKKIEKYCTAENPWLWRAITPYVKTPQKSLPIVAINDLYA